MIRYEDLKWGDSLGQGSFTRIFKGLKTDIRDGEEHVTEVLLKELDVLHKNCWEVTITLNVFCNKFFLMNFFMLFPPS